LWKKLCKKSVTKSSEIQKKYNISASTKINYNTKICFLKK
jgi:hypothetical protein